MTPREENQLNRREIEEARELLQRFQKGGFYTVPKIVRWVLHYEELFKFSFENRHNGSCFEEMSCPCISDSPENRFQELHSALQEMVELHQYENYFKKEMAVLENVLHDDQALMQWLKKNEKLGAEDFCIFWIEWLDDENTIVNPWIVKEQNLGIKFRAEEWQHTIKFLEVFNEIYWTSDACPSLEDLKNKTT